MSTALTTLASTLATRLNLGDSTGLLETLKATAFKGQVSDAQMTALLIVANQYGLNPWTKEVYAFPDKNNGIVPVVGVDGWSRIMNGHPQFDGMEFDQDEESCTCKIFRKDRSHAIQVTEFMSECKRNVGPWQSHPKRMLRHKSMIQCARLAFGFGGIYDQDEAERIVEIDVTPEKTAATDRVVEEKPPYPQERFDSAFSRWDSLIQQGAKSPQDIIAHVSAGYTLTEKQKADILQLANPPTVIEGEVIEND